MSESRESGGTTPPPTAQRTAKKPYHKPTVRFERVFETRALTCGKVTGTQAQCVHNKKTS